MKYHLKSPLGYFAGFLSAMSGTPLFDSQRDQAATFTDVITAHQTAAMLRDRYGIACEVVS